MRRIVLDGRNRGDHPGDLERGPHMMVFYLQGLASEAELAAALTQAKLLAAKQEPGRTE